MQPAMLAESSNARQGFAGSTREALGSQCVAALVNREGGRLRCVLYVFLMALVTRPQELGGASCVGSSCVT
eukprot:10386503-Alexandrium_andersonii.AAC.1